MDGHGGAAVVTGHGGSPSVAAGACAGGIGGRRTTRWGCWLSAPLPRV
uniref:Uncharacterized protein n=1 Tax=Nonomuraea gerenzanensis TaxID=93944 RepID=A0A1M4E925_9ACTN|nr:hypothetical protein BN4615_P4923 [Nonomuraea gerenzanensis]